MTNKENKKNKFSLIYKMGIIYIPLTSLLILIMASVAYQRFYKQQEVRFSEVIQFKVNNMADSIEALLNNVEQGISLIDGNTQTGYSGEGQFVDILEQYKDVEADSTEVVSLISSLNKRLGLYNWYLGICLGAGNNKDYFFKLYVNTKYSLTKYLPKDVIASQSGFFKSDTVKDELWYQQLLNTNGQIYYLTTDEEDYLKIGKCLKFISQKNWKPDSSSEGVLLLKLKKSWIEKWFYNKNEDTDMISILFNPEKKIWFVSSNGLDLKDEFNEEDIKQLLEIDTKSIHQLGLSVGDYLVKRNEFSSNLQLVNIMPTQKIVKNSMEDTGIFIVLAFLLMMVGMFILTMVNARIAQPIVRLANHMKKAKLQEIEYDNVGSREMLTLYEGYNKLIQHSEKLIADVYELAQEQKKAEFKVLQAQINPHFLYNALDSIGCLALLYKREDITNLLQSLAKIMRYNIKDGLSLIPFRNEIDIIKEYEKIQTNCYEGTVLFYYEIEPEVQDIKIPKLLIQPLVENAINHGMDFKEGQGIVEISAKIKNNRLEIRVWDNGTQADLDRINSCLRGEKQIDANGGGLGIYNIHERLKNQFGDKTEFYFTKDENGCTEAVIKINLTDSSYE